MIVVDDNGLASDMHALTKASLQEYINTKQVDYIAHERNMGGNIARNSGIYAALGKYIAFLDSDDVFYPKKIEQQLDYLETQNRNPKVRAVTCNRKKFAGGHEMYVKPEIGTGNFTRDILLLEKDLSAGSTLLIERDVLFELGLFDLDLKRHQEIELLIRYFEKYELTILSPVLVEIHVDDRSNIPDPESFIKNKKIFFDKLNHIIAKLSVDDKRRVSTLHTLEIAKVCIRHRRFVKGIRYIMKARPAFSDLVRFFHDAIYAAIGRILSRQKHL